MLRIVKWAALVGVFFFNLIFWIDGEINFWSLMGFSISLILLFSFLIEPTTKGFRKKTVAPGSTDLASQYLSKLVAGRPDRRIIRVEEIDNYLEKGFAPISQTIQGRVVVELKLETSSYLARTYVLMLSLLLNGSRDR